MNAISKPIPTMQFAQADHHAAVAARTKLTNRLKAAEDALKRAIAVRDALVGKVAAGGAVTAQDSRGAEQAIRDAESERALIMDALKIPDQAVAAAEGKIKLLNQIQWQRAYLRAAEARIALAEEFDRAGEHLSSLLEMWKTNEDEINESWSHGLNGRGPLNHEIEELRSEHAKYCFIPISIQSNLVRLGGVYHQSAAARTRGGWMTGMQDAKQKIAGFEEELSR